MSRKLLLPIIAHFLIIIVFFIFTFFLVVIDTKYFDFTREWVILSRARILWIVIALVSLFLIVLLAVILIWLPYTKKQIYKQHEIEEALLKSEKQYYDLVKYMPAAVAVYEAENGGENFIFRDFNQAGEMIEKVQKNNIIGKRVTDIFPGIIAFGLFAVFKRVWETGIAEKFPVALYKDNRIQGWRDNYVYRLFDGYVVAVYTDETGRKQAEQELSKSHERFMLVLNSLEAIVYVADMNTYEVLFINKYLEKRFGDIRGRPCWKSLQADQTGPCPFCSNRFLLDDEGKPTGVYQWEFLNTVNQQWYNIQDRAITWIDGHVVRLEIATDITAQKQGENALRTSLAEKTVLLKEVHHRVKNNLQIISSLINLQAAHMEKPDVYAALQETRDRIRSMALLHETLYRLDNMACIHFTSYIKSICNYLMHSYGMQSTGMQVEYLIDEITLSLDQAVTCGLIINELFSNALKYAFPGQSKGSIILEARLLPDNKLVLILSDNGIGLKPGTDLEQTETLGFQLVKMLMDKLDAQLEIDCSNGTSFRISFLVKQN